MAFENYNINQFMDAWFKKKYDELSKEEFDIVYAEYQDGSGLYMTEDFERITLINHLKARINYIKLFVKLQRDFIIDFGIPFTKNFETIKDKYGYILKWNGDLTDFERQLKKIELRQGKHITFFEEKVKEFNESRMNKKDDTEEENEDSLKKSRVKFIRMLNSLGKIGYKFDNKETSVEVLSLMIKQQLEESEELNSVQDGR